MLVILLKKQEELWIKEIHAILDNSSNLWGDKQLDTEVKDPKYLSTLNKKNFLL